MSGFNEIVLEWKDKKYTIPPNKVLMAIALIEDVITLPELQRYGDKGAVPLSKISMAYGKILRYANCSVTDVEVYNDMFGKNKTGLVVEAIITLISMMIPPDAIKEHKSGNIIAAAVAETAKGTSLSKKRTKLRSHSGK